MFSALVAQQTEVEQSVATHTQLNKDKNCKNKNYKNVRNNKKRRKTEDSNAFSEMEHKHIIPAAIE